MFCAEQLADYLGSTEVALEVVDTARLIVSELITNAVNASCSGTDLQLSCEGGSLRIAVDDDGDGLPTMRTAEQRDENGRGLAIIAALAANWGVVDYPNDGKQVWAEVTLPLALNR
jgi:anti-sigma regulatory factor (Ser/Thr protein kinase)